MQGMNPQAAMGYDRAITVFSPDGRLLQVEYARKAIELGATVLGIVCGKELLLVADRFRTERLLVSSSAKKIFQIDDHIISAAAGIISDARVLVKRSRAYTQQHKMTYGEKIDVEGLVKYIADIKQAYTQYGGIRPFGISLLIGGVDNKGAHLFITDPTGTYFEYRAKSIGSKSKEVDKILEDEYKEGMSVKEALKLAKSAFKKSLGKEYDDDRLECVAVTKNGVEAINVKG